MNTTEIPIPTNYVLVSGTESNLEKNVMEYIKDGYIPVGGLVADKINEGYYIQAMITYKEIKKNTNLYPFENRDY